MIETERRFYLANDVNVVRRDTEHDFYFEISMTDVWVWDIYRADRFVKSVRVLTKDVNVEELQRRDFQRRALARQLTSRSGAIRRLLPNG